MTHFLGAVVIQASESRYGAVQAWSIVNGQQRLTTLQVLLDAAAAAFEALELHQLQGQVAALTHNPEVFVGPGGVALKLRHGNRDQAAFDEVMLAEPPIDYEELVNSGSLLAKAHRYFSEEVTTWLDQSETPATVELRALTLTGVLTQSLPLVVIDLRADENSQEIFETLNARGTPLTAADLVKNFVFQRLAAERVDTGRPYTDLWPFETTFWEREVSVGRTTSTRASPFLNQWLISRVGEEIGPKSTFTRFKRYVEHEAGVGFLELVGALNDQADRYQRWTEQAAEAQQNLGAVEMCVYRSKATDTRS